MSSLIVLRSTVFSLTSRVVLSCVVISVLSIKVYVDPSALEFMCDCRVICDMFSEVLSTVSSKTSVNTSSVRSM